MLPQGFTRVEWIQSTGEQKLDMGILATNTTRLYLDCEITYSSGWTMLAGSYDASAYFSWWTSGTQLYGYFGSEGKNTTGPTGRTILSANANQWNTGNAALSFGNSTFTASSPLYLFSINKGGNYSNGKLRVYAAIAFVGSTPHCFVPVINADGEVGLYDMGTETFHGNEGTGEFIAGPIIKNESTLLLLHGSEIEDSSEYGRALTNHGVSVSDVQSKFGGKSLYFDGSARIEFYPIYFGESDFTIDWWEYVASANSEARFCSAYTTGTNQGGALIGYNGKMVYISSTTEGTNWDMISGAEMLINTLNTWVHWAVVRSGNTLTTYKDGKTYASASISGQIGYNAIYPSVIGDYRAGDPSTFIGYIDEFRISDGAVWTADFVPPTSEYGAVENAPPSSLTYTQVDGSASLTWESTSDAVKFRVYRDYTLIAETLSEEYADTITDAPSAHVYAVTAISEYGESDFSNSVRVEYWGDTAPDLVYDRTMADVNDAKSLMTKYLAGEYLTEDEQKLWDAGLRGCYNTSDVNRVEYHTRELQRILNENGYNIQIDTALWAKSDIMRYADIARYLGNIKSILDAFGRSSNAPPLPTIEQWIDYIAANDIEKILFVTRELIYGALAMFRRAGTFTAGNDYLLQIIRRT